MHGSLEGLIQPITDLVNESLKSGIIPSELKLARMVPIFKSGDPSLLANYRPILYFEKIFEKIFTIQYLIFYVKMIYYMITSLDLDPSIVLNKLSLHLWIGLPNLSTEEI